MNRTRAIAETVHLAALGVWLGTIGTAAIAAAVAFPTMRRLDPTLGAYEAFPGEHWPIAAGEVLFKVFSITDFVSVVCICLIAGSLIASVVVGKMPKARWSTRIRFLLLGCMLAAQAFSMFVLMPRMMHNVNTFWEAARAGDTEKAGEYRVLFNNDHPTSRKVSESLVVLITLSMIATGSSLNDPKARANAQ